MANSIKDTNIIISPLSVSSALTLLSQGANGSTFEELRQGLQLSDNKTIVANQFYERYEMLKKSLGSSVVSFANRIYVQQGYKIKDDFSKVAVEKFVSSVESLNFIDPINSAQIINEFVENQTNHKIKDLIKSDTLNSNTQVVLVNAVYFKGSWANAFKPTRTIKADFYLNETTKVRADLMRTEDDFNYAILDDLNATALEMKYANSNFSFVVILPNNRTGLTALEMQLKNYDLTKIQDQMRCREVSVTIPKFKVEFEINLNGALKNVSVQPVVFQKVNIKWNSCLFLLITVVGYNQNVYARR